jgi:hypothetical protein
MYIFPYTFTVDVKNGLLRHTNNCCYCPWLHTFVLVDCRYPRPLHTYCVLFLYPSFQLFTYFYLNSLSFYIFLFARPPPSPLNWLVAEHPIMNLAKCSHHWLIKYIDTIAKCRHLRKLTCEGTLRQGLSVWGALPPWVFVWGGVAIL